VFIAVAKALEEVAVKRAHAQDEAAQWKHKYEMELLRNAHLERLLADNAALGDCLHSQQRLTVWEIIRMITSFVCSGSIDVKLFLSVDPASFPAV
jgi:hypothetical protein